MKRSTVLSVLGLVLVTSLLLMSCAQQAVAPATPTPSTKPAEQQTAAPGPAAVPTPAHVAPTEPVKPVELRLYYTSVPGTSFDTVACTGLPDRIAKATNGKIKVILMPDLVKPADAFQALQDRRVDAMWFTAINYTSTYPWIGIAAVPGFFESEEQYAKAQRDTGFFKQVNDWTMSTFNARTIADTYTLSQVMYSKRPLSKIGDFKGLKMRTANAEQAALMTELGAKPTTVAWAELYMGLQSGVVDGAITGLDSGYGASFFEVVDYVTDWPNFRILNPRYFSINEDYWKSLPADVQKILEMEISQISADQIKGLKAEYDAVVKKYQGKGTTVTIVNDAAEIEKGRPAVLKVGNEWITRAKGKGYQFPADLVKYLQDKGYTVN